MPLIDDKMIDSLKNRQKTWSPFALFLLGAIPAGHVRDGKPLPPESEWRPKVICTKISGERKRTIEHEARRLKTA